MTVENHFDIQGFEGAHKFMDKHMHLAQPKYDKLLLTNTWHGMYYRGHEAYTMRPHSICCVPPFCLLSSWKQ